MMSHGLQATNSHFALVFSVAANDVDLRTVAIARGWNGTQRIKASILPGVVLQGASSAALTVSGAYPLGLELFIDATAALSGKAGLGGSAGYSDSTPGGNGGAGGLALSVSSAITITNNGTIAGGGGGGGGGAGERIFDGSNWYVTGGAGGNGARVGLAQTNGAAVNTEQAYYQYAGEGGNGGALGTAGTAGGNGADSSFPGVAGTAGAAGAAVTGNSNITWRATGTRTGAIS